MNREIKFRFWDKRNSKWWEPTYKASEGELEDLSITRNGQVSMRDITAHPKIVDDKFDIMQYTGIKDCNGKDIYEGDILTKELRDNNAVVRYGQVDLDTGYPWGAWSGAVCFYCDGWYGDGHEGLYKHDSLEVIGNIYETPELIES